MSQVINGGDDVMLLHRHKNEISVGLLSNNDNDEELGFGEVHTNLLNLILYEEKVYSISCFFGIVPVDCVLNSNFASFIRFWIRFLYTSLVSSLLPLFCVLAYLAARGNHQPYDVSTESFFILGQVVQVLVIIYTLSFLIKELKRKQNMNIGWYTEAFKYSKRIAILVFVFITSVYIITVSWYVGISHKHLPKWPILFTSSYLEYLLFTSSNFFLAGILFIMIVQQRISLRIVEDLTHKIQSKTLTNAEYFQAKQNIITREQKLPVNVLVIFAMLNTLFGVVSIFKVYSGQGAWISTSNHALDLLYYTLCLLSIFGRELIFLLVIMFEIVKVNDAVEIMLNTLAEMDWGEELHSKQNLLFMAMLKRPIGATIFYRKPQSYHILIQIASSVTVTVLAFIRLYLIRNS